MLLPFRPDSDPQGARTFIRNFYKHNAERSSQYKGESLKQELRLTDSLVLCSIIKWCWARMPDGVVSWPVYDGFRLGEKEAQMARNAFDTFIPIGVDSEARKSIIVAFYDLLTAVAAHGKNNGLGGRKLSRLAGWWAFHYEGDAGFEGGYKAWNKAADASSHLFFAYLRSLAPDTDPSMNLIERIPRSLQALLASTEYPPETPILLQRSTPRVVMMVDTVSPTPFALLRRAKNFEYRDRDHILRALSEFEDPVDALTEENKRVLYAVSSINQSSSTARTRHGLAKPDEAWSAFQNAGFSDIDVSQKPTSSMSGSTQTVGQGLRQVSRSRNTDLNRPTTPSWADFLSDGFADDGAPHSPTLLYPPAQVLPPLPLGSRSSTPGLGGIDENLAPGELAAITTVELDDAFWWVWMTSLAGEEPSARKSVFGRCALVETSIANGAWLIMEEQVKGAVEDPTEGAYLVPKKSLFSFTKRSRLGRKRSVGKSPVNERAPERVLSATPSKTSITTDQTAKIKAAARALTRKQEAAEIETARRGRHDDGQASKTNSMLTLGIGAEAGPAMQWAKSYDKHAIRQQYLGDAFAGKGMSREDLVRKTSSINLAETTAPHPVASQVAPELSTFQPEPAAHPATERELPTLPIEEPVSARPEPVAARPPTTTPPPPPPVVNDIQSVAPAVETCDIKAPPTEAEPTLAAPEQAAIPEPTLDESAAFDKEVGGSTDASPVSNRVGRKPVPRLKDHPAKREQPKPSPKAAPTTNPAAVAAAKAMFEKKADAAKLKKQPGNNAGFKKLFGKKKDSPGRGDSFDLQRPGSNGLVPPPESSIGRRISLMRRKHNAPAAVAAAHAAGPQSSQQDRASNYPPTEVSRSSIAERQTAEDEFARFDQGPIDDMPAHAPVYDDEPSPLPEEPKLEDFPREAELSQAAVGAQQDSHDHFIAPPTRRDPANDRESETTMDDQPEPHDPAVVQDRWAQIRENAHKRAERARQSEDQSEFSRPSRMTDDGETSGEESEWTFPTLYGFM